MPGRSKFTPAQRARAATKSRDTALLERNLMLRALIAQTGWTSHLEPLSKPQLLFPFALCLHTPAGPITWWLTADEVSLFEDLPVRPESHYDGAGHEEKLRRLSTLGKRLKTLPETANSPLAHLLDRFNRPTVARIEHEAGIAIGAKLPGRYYLYVRDDGRGVEIERAGKRKPVPRAGWFYADTLEKIG